MSWLGDLARDLGEQEARRLTAALGGTSIYVPSRLTDRLVALVGRAIACWLVERHGGQKIYVPLPERREADRKRARAMAEAGAHVHEIARALGRSERWVAKALRQ